MLSRLRSYSLPTQLALSSLCAVAIIFVVLIASVNILFEEQLNDIVTDHQLTEVKLLAHELEVQYEDINKSLTQSSQYANRELAESIKKQGNQWLWKSAPLSQSTDLLDPLKEAMDAEVLVVEDQQGSFNVIASTNDRLKGSLKKPTSATSYSGKWRVNGDNYIVHYQPISEHPGLSFVAAIPFETILKEVRSNLNGLKIGKRGYIYVTDAAEDKGKLIVHPSKKVENTNIFDQFSFAKSSFEKMYQQTSGVTRYTIQVAGQDSKAEESKVIFHRVDGWDWVVAIKTYSAEYSAEMMAILSFVTVICVIAALLLSVSLWLLIRSALQPLREIADGVHEIGQGNLSYRFPEKVSKNSNNETHKLQVSVQAMRDGLLSLIQKVQYSSEQLVTSVQSISNSNDKLITSATHSSNSCAQVAAAIEQMSASIEEVAQSSTEVSEETVSANESTKEGYQATKQVEETVSNLSTSFENAARTIQEVESSTENIGNVVNVINEIAEQTNLLALNAAIEAARAGEQGRGFAVVADEVRVLAQRTQQSTEEIKQVVEGLQKGSRSAVDTMQQGRDQVANCVQQATQAGSLLAGISHSMDTVSQGISNVAASTEEQSVAATQIRSNAEELHHDASQTFEEAQNSLSETQNINRLAEELKQNLTHFKL